MKLFQKLATGLLLSQILLGGCASSATFLPQNHPTPPRFHVQSASFQTPEWVREAVFYQIFPERFHNGNAQNDPPGTEPWGSPPTIDNFMGGDLQGVIQKLPYLKELGINAIYFNPIFESPSNHKYKTADYMKIDPHFGDMETFKTLRDRAHSLGIRIILDGVFNHAGHTHWAFQDAVKNGPQSKYWDWFNFYGFPVVFKPKPNYDGWWGHYTLPKFKESNPEVREHLYQIAKFWIGQGMDGWRLDVPNEIRDHNFWRQFRKVVKGVNPDAYIVGEIWEDASPWLQGDQFDSVMNYVFRKNVLDFFVNDTIDVDHFDGNLEVLRKQHPAPATETMFNLVGSHDTERIRTLAKGNTDKVKLAAFFQMTYVGAPVIYYGDEIGMEGGADPDDRRAMPWNPAQQDRQLQAYYKNLLQLRKQYPVLAHGRFRSVRRHNIDRTFAYVREDGQQTLLMAINNSDRPQDIGIDARTANLPDGILRDLLSQKTYYIKGGQVVIKQIPPRTGLIMALTSGK